MTEISFGKFKRPWGSGYLLRPYCSIANPVRRMTMIILRTTTETMAAGPATWRLNPILSGAGCFFSFSNRRSSWARSKNPCWMKEWQRNEELGSFQSLARLWVIYTLQSHCWKQGSCSMLDSCSELKKVFVQLCSVHLCSHVSFSTTVEKSCSRGTLSWWSWRLPLLMYLEQAIELMPSWEILF